MSDQAVVLRLCVLTFVDFDPMRRARVSQMDNIVREAEEQVGAEICLLLDKLK